VLNLTFLRCFFLVALFVLYVCLFLFIYNPKNKDKIEKNASIPFNNKIDTNE